MKTDTNIDTSIKLICNKGTISEIRLDLSKHKVLQQKKNVIMMDGRDDFSGVYLIFRNPDGSQTYDASFYPDIFSAYRSFRKYIRTGSLDISGRSLSYDFELVK